MLAIPRGAKAQDTAFRQQLMAGIDTTALYDSIMKELKMLGLVETGKQSFFDINITAGNGSFAQQNQSFKTTTNHLFLNGGLGYYHKSGFSFSGGVNTTSDNGNYTAYQAYISPGFDYSNKSISTGITAFRYFNKKDLGFYVSPLVNELYTYFSYHKGWLEPKLALDYGWGTVDQLSSLQNIDTVRYRRLAPIVDYLSRQQRTARVGDFSVLLSVRHNFIALSSKNSKRYFRYTPSLALVMGTSTYGTNTPLSSLYGPRMTNTTETRFFEQLFSSSNSLAAETPFQLQNFNISQNLYYNLGKTYLQGQLMFSYLIPSASSRWNVFFNIGAGISL